MSGWVDAGTGDTVGPLPPMISIPIVSEDEEKLVVTFQGAKDALGSSHWAPEQPTPYEVRRDALTAAAAYCASGGWGGAENVIEQVAKPFERFLNEAAGR